MRSDTKTIWRRRVVLMVAVGILIGLPVTLLIREDSAPDPPAPISADEPPLRPTSYDRKLGVELRVPRGWKREREGGVVQLASEDGSVRVAISSPGGAGEAGAIHREVLAGFRDSYEEVEVTSRDRRTSIGGLKRARATAVAAEVDADGESAGVDVLVTTAAGDKLAYLVVVFTREGASNSAALQAQALLNRLRFVG